MSRAAHSVLFLVLSLIASRVLAQAAPTPSKDWSLDLSTCIASTTAVTPLASYRLEVVLDSKKIRPVELRIVPAVNVQPASAGIKFALDKKTTYAFAPIAPEAGTTIASAAFWNIPRGTKDLISYLKRESKFSVSIIDSSPVATPLVFSLRGSSAALSDLQKRCNANQDFTADGFERAFLPAVVANVDPSKLQISDTTKLRELVATAYGAFRVSGATQTQLNALSQKYLTQINEYEKLRSNVDKLTSGTVAKLTKARNESQAKVAAATAEIPQLKLQVQQQEAALAQANTAVDQANTDIAPLLPERNRLRTLITNAESDVSSAQSSLNQATGFESQTRSRLQQVINGIAQSQSDINSIENQIQSIRSRLSGEQDTAERARRIYSDAQSNRQRFSRDLELRDRLARDSRYGSIDSDIRSQLSRQDSARQRAGQLESDRSRVASALAHCKEDPAANCSGEEQQVNDVENSYRQANDEVRDADNHIRDLQREKSRYEDQARSEVDRLYNDLIRYEQDAQSQYADAQSRANNSESKLRSLVSNDLPQAQSNLNSWQSARFGAENDVNSAVNLVARAERDVRNANGALDAAQSRYSDWKQSSGFNAKKAILSAAETKVEETKSTLKHIDENIAKDERLIRAETIVLADIDKQMQVALETIRQKEARSTEVQKILAPYFQQRDALMITKQQADQTFASAQTEFAAGLPQLVLAAQ